MRELPERARIGQLLGYEGEGELVLALFVDGETHRMPINRGSRERFLSHDFRNPLSGTPTRVADLNFVPTGFYATGTFAYCERGVFVDPYLESIEFEGETFHRG